MSNDDTESNEDAQDQQMGVEFGSLADELDAEEYPMSKEQVVDKYGDHELNIADGTKTVQEVLGQQGDEEFQSANDVQQSILNMVGSEAVGRQRYSDRALDDDPQDGSNQSF
ncbi:DUF5789 family protein [Halopelagius longus]|uniref:DUF2795 domain-containing protein n=1 Tax=Halopelagius longus TaxID=1236180 RepID=A0A1H0YLG1_9EURY|nr:DUF5789 family protein [Halopelagius longus]RDI72552.1 hypothetical protein DWB78_12950 [Halopelagius longus]SDQ15978.1 hypothetical protein SAMN05216278_0707 [Halopelagius longus]